MSYNGSGTYSPPSPQYPAISGAVIYAADFNTIISDIATALSLVLVKDGQTAMTGILSFGGFKGTNLAAPVATTDATNKTYVDTATALLTPFIVTADRAMYGYKITGLGTPTAATDAATKGYVDTADALKANLVSPTFTGVPAAPTATFGTSTTQLSTTAFVAAAIASLPAGSLPSLPGNGRKVLTVNAAETAVLWQAGGISQVTTATTATTLTNTPTLLRITPTSYGVTVKLPDATTCSVGGPLHCIDNRGAYPVRVTNSADLLLGFIFAGVVSYISCDDIGSAAGVWAIENNELVGASAQLLSINFYNVHKCIDLGGGREILVHAKVSNGYTYATVYDRSTNTWGASTLVRSADGYTAGAFVAACLSGTDQVLVCSAPGSTAFEAVCLTVTGTSIAVGTAATTALSATLSTFADGCGLIAVGSSFVTSYTVATPAAQIRAMSISGTTVTIGAASVLDGTASGLIAAATSHVIAVSEVPATFTSYSKPYLVSGSSLTAGTGTSTAVGAAATNGSKLAALGTRWFTIWNVAGSVACYANIISLNATGNGTTTVSNVTILANGFTDAIVVSSSKVLVLGNATSSNANILTDTAGTASAGTAITLSSGTNRVCIYVSGTDVIVGEQSQKFHTVDCSGASPVKTRSLTQSNNACLAFTSLGAASNSVLRRSSEVLYGTVLAQRLNISTSTAALSLRINSGSISAQSLTYEASAGVTPYRGKAESERWISDAATVITKLECVV